MRETISDGAFLAEEAGEGVVEATFIRSQIFCQWCVRVFHELDDDEERPSGEMHGRRGAGGPDDSANEIGILLEESDEWLRANLCVVTMRFLSPLVSLEWHSGCWVVEKRKRRVSY